MKEATGPINFEISSIFVINGVTKQSDHKQIENCHLALILALVKKLGCLVEFEFHDSTEEDKTTTTS